MIGANIVADICFFIDIPITFRTTNILPNGDETDDPKKIAWIYLQGMFTIDFLSVVPLDLIAMMIFTERTTD